MSPDEFRTLTERLRAVPLEGVDCDGALAVFAKLAKKTSWSEAIAAFDEIAASELPPGDA